MQISGELKRSARLHAIDISERFSDRGKHSDSPVLERSVEQQQQQPALDGPRRAAPRRDRYGASECGPSRYREEDEERYVRLSRSFPAVTLCIRPASELPVRIESAESPVEANCQLLRRSQPGAYYGTELEIPWRGSLEPSATRDRTIGFILACIYIRTYAGCGLCTDTRDLLSRIKRVVGTRALTCQKFNQSPRDPQISWT